MGAFLLPIQHLGQKQVSLLISRAWSPRLIYVEVTDSTPYLEWPKVPDRHRTQSLPIGLSLQQLVVLRAAAAPAHPVIVSAFTFLFPSVTFAFMSVEPCMLKYFCYTFSLISKHLYWEDFCITSTVSIYYFITSSPKIQWLKASILYYFS